MTDSASCQAEASPGSSTGPQHQLTRLSTAAASRPLASLCLLQRAILVLGGIPKGSGQLHTLSALALWPPRDHSATKSEHGASCTDRPVQVSQQTHAYGRCARRQSWLIPATSIQPRLGVRRQRRATPSGAAVLKAGLSRQPIVQGFPRLEAKWQMIIQRNSARQALPGAPTRQRAGCTNAPASLSAILERGENLVPVECPLPPVSSRPKLSRCNQLQPVPLT